MTGCLRLIHGDTAVQEIKKSLGETGQYKNNLVVQLTTRRRWWEKAVSEVSAAR